jgi:DNA-directed RNA polymerase specialized sigma24 family protein
MSKRTDQFLAMWARGHSVDEIAAHFGVRPSAVHSALFRYVYRGAAA